MHCLENPKELQNYRLALNKARPLLRILIQRKGESDGEKYGYGSVDRRRGIAKFIGHPQRPKYNISQPEDFRLVSVCLALVPLRNSARSQVTCKIPQKYQRRLFGLVAGISVDFFCRFLLLSTPTHCRKRTDACVCASMAKAASR